MEPVEKRAVTLLYDQEAGVRLPKPKRARFLITNDLAGVFARATVVNGGDTIALSFTSVLVGMVTGNAPSSKWLKEELARQGADIKKFAAKRKRVFDEHSLRSIPDLSSSPELTTSMSARKAIEGSQAIAIALGNAVIDARHVIAAYPTLAEWHDQDFAELGIDRLAWCRRFGEQMAVAFPAEKAYWRKYADRASPVPLTSFNADVYNEKDLLGVDRSVDALALLIASTRTETPLSIGVFGPWGSGKSFFMRHLRKRLWGLAGREQARVGEWKRKREAATATEADAPLYYGQIAQVEFNAWHYNEGNLVASLVDHLFRNLRVLPGSADTELEERRTQVLLQMSDVEVELTQAAGALERAKEQVAVAEKGVQTAGQEVLAARRDVEAKRNELVSTTAEAEEARQSVEASMTRLLEEAGTVNPEAAISVALDHLAASPAVAQIKETAATITAAIADWRGWLGRLASPRGAVVVLMLVATAAAVWLMDGVMEALASFGGIATAIGAATIEIRAFLRKRREEFDAMFAKVEREEATRREQQRQQLEQEKARIDTEWTARLDALRAEIAGHQSALREKEDALAAAGRALAEETTALEEKVRARTSAEEEHRQLQARLERLSSALLLDEFIKDRSGTDEYRKQLGFLALVRRDFERLSDLIASANREWLSPASKAKAPLLNRIILYIDDLDRCSPDTVVKVLEVVHLLLAFPLFVCVVAVDPRWIEKCLREKHQFGFAAGSDAENAHATVGDYLEKIFQIPIWMNPIEPSERAAVVRSLLGPIAVEEHREDAEEGEPQTAIHVPAPRHVVAIDGFQAAIRKAEEVPDPLQITATEAAFVQRVAPLLSDKPRALIRFVNIYRLLKATLPHIELQTFVSDDDDSPHKICMIQLAFFTGYPRVAARFVQRLREPGIDDTQTLGTLLSKNVFVEAPSLVHASRLIPDAEVIPVTSFVAWLPETSKYLFHRDV
jgi:KAP family P-loop domain